MLEIASGTGEHAAWFSAAFPHVTWQPTDRDGEALATIGARCRAAGLDNLRAPVPLDAAAPGAWPVARADVVVAINMIHIAPWTATEGLLRGAARVLAPDGVLFLYGPFIEAGVPTGEGNALFDAGLRARDPAWGLRDLGAVTASAHRHGMRLRSRIAMPANNLSLVFERATSTPVDGPGG